MKLWLTSMFRQIRHICPFLNLSVDCVRTDFYPVCVGKCINKSIVQIAQASQTHDLLENVHKISFLTRHTSFFYSLYSVVTKSRRDPCKLCSQVCPSLYVFSSHICILVHVILFLCFDKCSVFPLSLSPLGRPRGLFCGA